MYPLRDKLYLLVLVTILNILFLAFCICIDHQHPTNKNDNQHKLSSLDKQEQILKALRSANNQNATNSHQKQGVASRGKHKSHGNRKHKKFNETEFLQTIPLQLAHDLSLQLPEINFGGYLQSALGGGGGSSSRVLLKLHKTPEANKAAPKIQSVRDTSSGLSKQETHRLLDYDRDDEPVVSVKLNNNTSRPIPSGKPLKRHKRQTPCSQGEELDDYVDQLFRFGTRIVRAMEPITLPNATIDLPDYNIQIFLYEGRGTRAYKFKRTKPAWVFCSNETISLGLTIEVEELRVAYKYRVISGDKLIFDGDLEARLSPKVQAQFSQAIQPEDSEEPVMQRVDRIRVFRLGRVHVVIRGLGNLTQSLSMIINSYLNDNQEELQPTFRMIEGDAVKMINKMLANVNVPLLNVV